MSRLFNDDERDYFMLIYKGRTTQETATMMRTKFGKEWTAQQVRSYIKNHKLKNGCNTQFRKGHVPFNKDKKFQGKTNRTTWKKGNIPHNYKPVGSERLSRDGYIEVKVADHNKWRLKHVAIYEQAHGKVPKGHKVIFLDQNRMNVSLDNLEMISDSELLYINKNIKMGTDVDANRVRITMSKVMTAASRKAKERKK